MDTHLRGGKIKRSKDSGWTPVFTGERFSCILVPTKVGIQSFFPRPAVAGGIHLSDFANLFVLKKMWQSIPSVSASRSKFIHSPPPFPRGSAKRSRIWRKKEIRNGPLPPRRDGGKKKGSHSLLFSCTNAKLTTSIIIKKKKFYTLNITTSPSCIIYSFPSVRTFPTSFAFDQEDASKSSSHPITSALIKRSLKSL